MMTTNNIPCPCSKRQLEDQSGQIVWRASDKGEHCRNEARMYTTLSGEVRFDGWCEDCVTKVCKWCRHD